MNRIINIKVKGNHLTKDSNNAGTRGEANVTTLRITFGDDWNAYVKKILFWDAHGMNPTKYTLIHDGKEPSNVYLYEIPKSALGLAGDMTFRIDGCIDNKRQVSVSATLEVGDALIVDGEEEIPKADLDNVTEKIEELEQTIIDGVSATETAAGNAKTSAGQAAEAQGKAAEAQGKAEEAQGKAEEAYDNFIEKRDETYNIIGNRVSQVEGYIEDVIKLKKQAEDAKEAAETAKKDALAYASSFTDLSEAVTRAETSASFVETQTELIYGYKEQAGTAKEAAEKTLNAAEKLSEDIEVAKSDIELAMQSVSSSSYWAKLSSASAEEAKNEAENAVSQSRYIGANGNWYVWDSSKKTFVDSGETAHAGSTVYVGSNPPSNAQVWIDPDDDSDIAMSIKEIYNTIKSMKPKAVTITLLSSAWVVDGDRYAQIVSIPEATAYSKVDLQPSAEQLTIFHEKDIAFVTENVGGTITVYCIGQKPTNDYTIQATITEVSK